MIRRRIRNLGATPFCFVGAATMGLLPPQDVMDVVVCRAFHCVFGWLVVL